MYICTLDHLAVVSCIDLRGVINLSLGQPCRPPATQQCPPVPWISCTSPYEASVSSPYPFLAARWRQVPRLEKPAEAMVMGTLEKVAAVAAVASLLLSAFVQGEPSMVVVVVSHWPSRDDQDSGELSVIQWVLTCRRSKL
jgi:hypothetical protein